MELYDFSWKLLMFRLVVKVSHSRFLSRADDYLFSNLKSLVSNLIYLEFSFGKTAQCWKYWTHIFCLGYLFLKIICWNYVLLDFSNTSLDIDFWFLFYQDFHYFFRYRITWCNGIEFSDPKVCIKNPPNIFWFWYIWLGFPFVTYWKSITKNLLQSYTNVVIIMSYCFTNYSDVVKD